MLERINNKVHLDKVSLEEVAREFGTPCYVYSKSSIIREFIDYKEAFSECADVKICYSVKANSNINILKTFKELGAGFDIVSLGELERLKLINADPKKIVFSGVAKSDEEILESLRYGILFFNVESQDELENINLLAAKINKVANISLRVNPDIDPKTHPYISTGLKSSKFGIAVDQALEIYKVSKNLKNVNPIGIDAHIGSQILDFQPFNDSLDRLEELFNKLRELSINIEYIDIGGGLGIKYSDDDIVPSKKDFAKRIVTKINKLKCGLVLEPGRSLVGNSGVLLTSVVYEKNNYGKDFLIVDAGMNDILRPSLYDAYHKIEKVSDCTENKKTFDIVGPICETGDVLGRDVQINNPKKGDVLVINSAGAYGHVMSSNYNSKPKAPEVLIDNGKAKLIKKRETITQILENEIIL